MKLIETRILSSAQANIQFTNIPQDGTDLYVLVSDRSDRSAGAINDAILMRPNNAVQTARRLYGSGSGQVTDTSAAAINSANSSTANNFSNISFYISNYSSSTQNKVWSSDAVIENSATLAYITLLAGLYSSNTPITSITFLPEVGPNFLAGTTISLYKITKGSSGGVTTTP
jgi:hypothetical protein